MRTLSFVDSVFKTYCQAVDHVSFYADSIPPLFLRLVLAIEFGQSGYEKFHGSNWFQDLSFPFPFNLLPTEVSWHIATYFEIFGAAALVLGLATRFFSVSLFILTVVAIASVHWPNAAHSLSDLVTGYRIIDENGDGLGNYKLPLIYIMMFLPLIFGGAGKLSADSFIYRILANQQKNNF